MIRITTLLLALVALAANPLCAADWGDVTGTFIFDGPIPKPDPAVINKDLEVCGKHNLVDESLLVSPNGGLQNVVVWIYARAGSEPTIHPSYAETEKAEVVLDNKNCRFAPHVLAMRTTQTLVLANSDPVGHSSKIDFFANNPVNPNLPAGGQMKLAGLVTQAERLPCPVSCGIHGWMRGHVLVQEHPYFAVADANGKFTIKNVPAGEWTFKFWHEKSGYVQEVNVGGKDETWKRGELKLDVKAGDNDLGMIKVKPAAFEK